VIGAVVAGYWLPLQSYWLVKLVLRIIYVVVPLPIMHGNLPLTFWRFGI
jgi:hypothetical protein